MCIILHVGGWAGGSVRISKATNNKRQRPQTQSSPPSFQLIYQYLHSLLLTAWSFLFTQVHTHTHTHTDAPRSCLIFLELADPPPAPPDTQHTQFPTAPTYNTSFTSHLPLQTRAHRHIHIHTNKSHTQTQMLLVPLQHLTRSINKHARTHTHKQRGLLTLISAFRQPMSSNSSSSNMNTTPPPSSSSSFPPPDTHPAYISSLSSLSPTTRLVELHLLCGKSNPPRAPFTFKAGQWVDFFVNGLPRCGEYKCVCECMSVKGDRAM